MFTIRRIFDDTTEGNRTAIAQVQAILKSQFYLLSPKEIEELPLKLRDPMGSGFRSVLYVSVALKGVVDGFALMQHAPDLDFCFLDFLSAAPGKTGRGLGSILYERLREEARLLKADGIYLECLPDDPALSPNPEIRRQNVSRLRFYERYGVRPIVNTRYETPLKEGDTDPPYLLYDDLGTGTMPSRDQIRKVVRAILERKYRAVCPPGYIDMVVESFNDNPVVLREPKYFKAQASVAVAPGVPESHRIALVVNEGHAIHHVRDRGYVESPVRMRSILAGIEPTGLFLRQTARVHSERFLHETHDRSYVDYFHKVCKGLPPDKPIYPYVFPIRNAARKPRILSVRAGYYCIDTFTPLTRNAWEAARGAVNCALTAAESLLEGRRIAYALVRPPGHHAETKAFGGFCYFNSSAIAANYLSRSGRVAMLDIDHHHGNGQQEIFYSRNDVLTVSIHGHPNVTYPYFSGFRDERGYSNGLGYNVNYPLPEGVDGPRYRETLTEALKQVARFRPDFLVLAFGLDTARNDPTGSWMLTSKDFQENGMMIGRERYKTLVVQEGGYDNRVIGTNARRFFEGLWQGYFPYT